MDVISYMAGLSSAASTGPGPTVRISIGPNGSLPQILENPTSAEGRECTGTWYLESQDDETKAAFYRMLPGVSATFAQGK